ncbi:imidazolonepropionase [Oscillibacter sp.]|uniref:imidazolonepropionase n=1 Tax=Oscillibacter sp. TaxID=1945593 RepID=UPI00289CEB6B|nr:imidazolonepropionase [Oscillibacter sp.]
MANLLVKNIGLLATPVGSAARRGKEQGEITMLKNAYVLVKDGLISAVGEGAVPAGLSDGAEVVDAGGRLVTPGLVDAHTHLIFGGWRQNELGMKLHGVSYLEILAQGGGILSTVRSTRAASEEELTDKAAKVLDDMLRMGITTCEAKSGYGLTPKDEYKQLRVIHRLNETHKVEVVPTFMGAHAVPEEFKEDREGYLRLLCEEMIPTVAREQLAEFCDVFCETGVFTAEESRRILEAAKAHGLIPKIHADEIDPIGGSQLAGEIGAISAEHLIVCPEAGIESLAKGGVIACLLPGTSFYLGATFAPARAMLDAGVAVAVSTDFNPGSCPSANLQLAMNIACLKYRLTPEEVLTAVTLNGAAAVRRADRLGSVEVGKQGDLLVWDAPDLDYICYRLGANLVDTVIKQGEIVRF